jgi:hypothetical protein
VSLEIPNKTVFKPFPILISCKFSIVLLNE